MRRSARRVFRCKRVGGGTEERSRTCRAAVIPKRTPHFLTISSRSGTETPRAPGKRRATQQDARGRERAANEPRPAGARNRPEPPLAARSLPPGARDISASSFRRCARLRRFVTHTPTSNRQRDGARTPARPRLSNPRSSHIRMRIWRSGGVHVPQTARTLANARARRGGVPRPCLARLRPVGAAFPQKGDCHGEDSRLPTCGEPADRRSSRPAPRLGARRVRGTHLRPARASRSAACLRRPDHTGRLRRFCPTSRDPAWTGGWPSHPALLLPLVRTRLCLLAACRLAERSGRSSTGGSRIGDHRSHTIASPFHRFIASSFRRSTAPPFHRIIRSRFAPRRIVRERPRGGRRAGRRAL